MTHTRELTLRQAAFRLRELFLDGRHPAPFLVSAFHAEVADRLSERATLGIAVRVPTCRESDEHNYRSSSCRSV